VQTIVAKVDSSVLLKEDSVIQAINNTERTNKPIASITCSFEKEFSSLVGLLKVLSQENEFGILYYLMNKVEINEFEYGKISMKPYNVNRKVNTELAEILYKYTNKEWDVVVAGGDENGKPLKESLLQNASKTDIWERVLTQFPSAKITDVLLKR
jgi:translation elongation factor EF-G